MIQPNFTIPIDISPVINAIPAGEPILYSTLMIAINKFTPTRIPSLINVIAEALRKKDSGHLTHVLFTENGIACVMVENKNPFFLPWENCGVGLSGETANFVAIMGGSKPIINYFSFYFDGNYESENAFMQRSRTFPLLAWPLRIKYLKKDLDDPAKKRNKKERQKKEEFILKNEQNFKHYAHLLGIEIINTTEIPYDKILF